jgi:hypothetical protein
MIHAMVCAGRLERIIYLANEKEAQPILKEIETLFGDSTSDIINIDKAPPIESLGRKESIISAYFAGAPSWFKGEADHYCIKYHTQSLKRTYKIVHTNKTPTVPVIKDHDPEWVGYCYDKHYKQTNECHVYYRGMNSELLNDYLNFYAMLGDACEHPASGYEPCATDLICFIFKGPNLTGAKLYIESPPVSVVCNDLKTREIYYESTIGNYIENPQDSPFVEFFWNGCGNFYAMKGSGKIIKGISK